MGRQDYETETLVAHALRGEGFDASEDGTGRGTPLVPVAFHPTQDPISSVNGTTHALGCGSKAGTASVAIAAFKAGQGPDARSIGYDEHLSPTLSAADSGTNRTPSLMHGQLVRRLTPRECERLQGFPDDYTLIPYRGKPAADGPRYKALGNSMAVPVMRWIGERIAEIEELQLTLAV